MGKPSRMSGNERRCRRAATSAKWRLLAENVGRLGRWEWAGAPRPGVGSVRRTPGWRRARGAASAPRHSLVRAIEKVLDRLAQRGFLVDLLDRSADGVDVVGRGRDGVRAGNPAGRSRPGSSRQWAKMRVEAVGRDAGQLTRKASAGPSTSARNTQSRRRGLTARSMARVHDEEAREMDVGKRAERHERVVGRVLPSRLRAAAAVPPRGQAGSRP